MKHLLPSKTKKPSILALFFFLFTLFVSPLASIPAYATCSSKIDFSPDYPVIYRNDLFSIFASQLESNKEYRLFIQDETQGYYIITKDGSASKEKAPVGGTTLKTPSSGTSLDFGIFSLAKATAPNDLLNIWVEKNTTSISIGDWGVSWEACSGGRTIKIVDGNPPPGPIPLPNLGPSGSGSGPGTCTADASSCPSLDNCNAKTNNCNTADNYQPKVIRESGEGGYGYKCTCISTLPASTCNNGTPGVETGLGCIPSDPKALAGWVLGLAIGLGTLIAILFIIIGGYTVLTSAGNPDQLEEGKQQITAAIEGLIVILVSVLILTIIGVNILGIPKSLFGF